MQDRHVSLYRNLQCIFNSLFGVVCFILYSQSVVQRTNISTFCTWFGFSSSARSCNVYLLPLRGFVNPVQSSVVMFALPLLVMANSQKLLPTYQQNLKAKNEISRVLMSAPLGSWHRGKGQTTTRLIELPMEMPATLMKASNMCLRILPLVLFLYLPAPSAVVRCAR